MFSSFLKQKTKSYAIFDWLYLCVCNTCDLTRLCANVCNLMYRCKIYKTFKIDIIATVHKWTKQSLFKNISIICGKFMKFLLFLELKKRQI